eukprot:4019716-Pleurochrysis_carterae.AAC.2
MTVARSCYCHDAHPLVCAAHPAARVAQVLVAFGTALRYHAGGAHCFSMLTRMGSHSALLRRRMSAPVLVSSRLLFRCWQPLLVHSIPFATLHMNVCLACLF